LNIAIQSQSGIQGRRAGFLSEVAAVAERALVSIKRDPETVIPGLIIPVFFFVVTVGALQDMAETIPAWTSRRSNCRSPSCSR
jgi:hypothetical protein